MTITATGRNLRPYQGRCVVFGSGGTALAYLKHEVNDSPRAATLTALSARAKPCACRSGS